MLSTSSGNVRGTPAISSASVQPVPDRGSRTPRLDLLRNLDPSASPVLAVPLSSIKAIIPSAAISYHV